ncbi:bifunctional hydroxymethylpyrimidine kinase/phosphomethylpyrimidine kinase [Mycetocola reblochoni]|uniref:Hydroxymethylpyrimidine phosphate kinase ThiD n=2 Tax=Mycetocola reblochoni TaxID=331618 RepID=A0A1R4JNZ6_9MICO|nr:bifunctional hydroxymethylpyrimidine kinase/phosphomethylpyrimidine kinase [Mycetocola reblochoni]RLP68609.1 bifunctional hydroxymethylpyrimidine kinase/phosphomethylpyrimidine kinase [Mycetocola reblochoni]SJN33515.1 Hydroxymethylpyrimidine phosphate kinase ThiD [Mycetocola reblochoni REB411]
MSAPGVSAVLSIAGTDPSGGAGIQADLKSIAAHGGYGMAVVTALVAQNTTGVREVHLPPVDFLRAQLDAVSDDVRLDAVKIGMLGTASVVAEVADWLRTSAVGVPVVLDPVMVATSGDRLLEADAESAVRALLTLATVVTPNLPELGILAAEPPAADWPSALAQAGRVARAHGVTVLVKGGHLESGSSPDALVSVRADAPDGVDVVELPAERVRTRNSHGTGCSLSSALATLIASGETVAVAAALAKEWLSEALRRSEELDVGRGRGPVNHFAGSLGTLSPAARLRAGGGVREPVTSSWWRDTETVRRQTERGAFVRALADGSLAPERFDAYLAQDAIYLDGYADVLAAAALTAPDDQERAFWADAAVQCRDAEMQLHLSRLSGRAAARPWPTTVAYLDHLRTAVATGSHLRVSAAVLPCYWVYRDIGLLLHEARHPAHPYDDWLATYGDAGFDEATERAIGYAERAAAADPDGVPAAGSAFYRSTALERDFFAAPVERDLRELGVPPAR